MNYWTQGKDNIYVAGHRGWRGKYPENTMKGFKAAFDIGIDQIETDVHITKDGELVLIHDKTVDRTTNGTGKVCDMTLAELRQLDAGDGEQIPTFKELLELASNYPTVTLDIELKEYPEEGWEEIAFLTCDKTLEMIDEYGFTDRVVINSFSGKLNEYVHKTYGKKYRQYVYYPEKWLGEITENPYLYTYCTCVFGLVEGEVSVDEVKELVKTTNTRIWGGPKHKDDETIDLAVKAGMEVLTVDNPDEVLEILRRKNLHK